MKDTFLTIGYKGGYIHSHHDRELGREVVSYQAPGSFTVKSAKSRHAAKIAISKA